jgi:hypothetical protein
VQDLNKQKIGRFIDILKGLQDHNPKYQLDSLQMLASHLFGKDKEDYPMESLFLAHLIELLEVHSADAGDVLYLLAKCVITATYDQIKILVKHGVIPVL